VPNYANLAIWGLPVFVVNRRLTCRRPESATITGHFLGYAGSHHIITYKNDVTGAIQYASIKFGLNFFHERYPEKWLEVQKLLNKGYTPEQFAVKMFMFVQGRTDAS
jgi:hypothetical protein